MTPSAKAAKTAERYVGAKARDYDARRAGQPKWIAEDRAVRAALADLPAGARVLDVPCGTGRFFAHYTDRKFQVHAIDVSPDMLALAKRQAGAGVQCAQGSIFALTVEAVDVAICCRFMNLVEEPDMALALGELQRVAHRRILFTLRTAQTKASGQYHSPHSLAAVERALAPGWRLASAESLHQTDYRLVRLERAV